MRIMGSMCRYVFVLVIIGMNLTKMVVEMVELHDYRAPPSPDYSNVKRKCWNE